MPFKIVKTKNGRYIVVEKVGTSTRIRANKSSRKEAQKWIKENG